MIQLEDKVFYHHVKTIRSRRILSNGFSRSAHECDPQLIDYRFFQVSNEIGASVVSTDPSDPMNKKSTYLSSSRKQIAFIRRILLGRFSGSSTTSFNSPEQMERFANPFRLSYDSVWKFL